MLSWNEQNRTIERVVVGAVGFFSDYLRVAIQLAKPNLLSEHGREDSQFGDYLQMIIEYGQLNP